MTALDLLPADTRAAVLAPDPTIRGDLLAIPKAEAEGWTVTFRENNWHNAAEFTKGELHIWLARPSGQGTTLMWRSALRNVDKFLVHEWHFNLGDAIQRATRN